jgi:integrase
MVYTRSPDYLYRRNGIFYFTRNVPSDLKGRFNKNRVVVSLHTRSEVRAQKAASALSDRLERYFESLRLERFHSQELGLKFGGVPDAPLDSVDTNISDALELYIRLKGAGRDHLFAKTSTRNVGYLIECIGDVGLSSIKPVNAGQFRDHLIAKGLASTSVRRVLSSVKAIYNLASKELGIVNANPFSGIFIPDDNAVSGRLPVPVDTIRLIQHECFQVDDSKRWLIAIISDTGMRLSEAAGLLTEDIKLDVDVPHIKLRKHPWRSLKTASSERNIPLVGSAYEAAIRIVHVGHKYAFARYCDETKCNANSASAALNKWLKPRMPDGCVIHSFRHSLRDRLRAIECPSDIIDAIGGWTTAGIGHKYGSGYDLAVKYRWMKMLEG